MIVLIDNYDSFSYNLYQLVGSLRTDIQVIRNDAVTVEELRAMKPDCLILSPGPGRPKDAGICEAAVLELGGEFPILGVCLGHQAICEAYGATVGYAKRRILLVLYRHHFLVFRPRGNGQAVGQGIRKGG